MTAEDPRIAALPDIHGHAKGEHKPFIEERPIPYTARMLFLWFFHACRRASPRFLMVADHINYLTFEDPSAVNLVRRALKLAAAGDLYGAAETAGVDLAHAAVVSEGLRKGMRYSIGAEIDNDPRSRPDAQNIVDAMRPDGMIRSIHFLPINHPVHGENWMWPFDNPDFKEFYEVVGVEQTWELYMAALLEAIDKLPGNIVGHFYVPAKFGHWPSDESLERYEDQLVAACAERGMAIELNSRYFYKYFADDEAQLQRCKDVNLRLLRKAKAQGVVIAVGSDAHSPRDQGSAFDQVLALLDAAEINEIAFPINGRLARVALRATEEILRKRSSAAAAAAGSSVSGFGRSEVGSSGRNGGPPSATEDEEEDEDLVAATPPPRERRSHAAASPPASAGEADLQVERDVPLETQTLEAAPTAAEAPAPKRAPRPRPKRAKAAKAPEATVTADEAEQSGLSLEGEGPEAANAAEAEFAGVEAPLEPAQAEPALAESGNAAEPPPAEPAKSAPRTPAKAKAPKATAAKAAAPKALAPKVAAVKAASPKPAAKAAAVKKTSSAKKAVAKKAPTRPAATKARAVAKKAAPARKTAAKAAKRSLSPAKRAPAVKKSVAKKAPAKKKASKTKR
ncbi:MAG: hypothetical protein ACLPSH_11950 [Vulcanimicrobiaceae bacterium]